MKLHALVLVTLALMTAFTPTGISPANPGERPAATACLTVVNLGVGCASGTLSHVMGACGSTCDVTLRADLLVTPVACGWVGWELRGYFGSDVATCAAQRPEPKSGMQSLDLPPGAYQVQGEVCVTDPTITVTVPCERIWHNFVVPGDAGSAAAFATSLIPDQPPNPFEIGRAVYEDATFILYELI